MTKREVMQLALDALYSDIFVTEAMEALRAELAKPEPEPIMWTRIDRHGVTWIYSPNEDHHEEAEPLYRKEDL